VAKAQAVAARRLPIGLGLPVQRIGRHYLGLIQTLLREQLAGGVLDKGDERGMGLNHADAGQRAHPPGDQQGRMAIAEQRLGIVDQGIGQAVDIVRRTGLSFEAEKLGKQPIREILLRRCHGMPSNCAVPLIPASKPLASAGNVAISNRVWLPSSMRAPRRLTSACNSFLSCCCDR